MALTDGMTVVAPTMLTSDKPFSVNGIETSSSDGKYTYAVNDSDTYTITMPDEYDNTASITINTVVISDDVKIDPPTDDNLIVPESTDYTKDSTGIC